MKEIGFALVGFIAGVLIVAANATSPQDRVLGRAETQQPPRAIWYMHAGQDTVGAVIIDLGNICKPRS